MNAAIKLASVPDDAGVFLGLLASGEQVTFQTFGEGTAKGARGLNRILHGTLAQHRQTLVAMNGRGAGVFWMVTAGDGKGRKASNVQRVRALFVDLDGSPLEPVQAAPLRPHCIIESSPNRWHAYWRMADCPLADFTPLQKALAERFDADTTVHDLPRVMRLPGFLHRKADPFPSRIVDVHDTAPYTVAAFRKAFTFEPVTPVSKVITRPPTKRRKLPDAIPEGERNKTLLSLAAGLVRKGHTLIQVRQRLHRINADRCMPPLETSEVDHIAAQAIAYGSEGFARLPHALLDSPAWKALTPRAHDVVIMAFRRYDGTGAGIALTWADFDGRTGFAKSQTFYRARRETVAAGILQCVREGRITQTGRKPDLFNIAPKWLRDVRQPQ